MLELAVGVFQCLGAENQYRGAANMGFLALVLALTTCFLDVHGVSFCTRTATSTLLHIQFLITSSMQKRREKAWGISSRGPRHDRQMSSRVLSTAK